LRFGTLFVPNGRKLTFYIKVSLSEVIEMQTVTSQDISEPKLYRLRICQDGRGSYAMSFTHTGEFRLIDYDEVDLEIAAARLVKRS
jgi:hypothetical protein